MPGGNMTSFSPPCADFPRILSPRKPGGSLYVIRMSPHGGLSRSELLTGHLLRTTLPSMALISSKVAASLPIPNSQPPDVPRVTIVQSSNGFTFGELNASIRAFARFLVATGSPYAPTFPVRKNVLSVPEPEPLKLYHADF